MEISKKTPNASQHPGNHSGRNGSNNSAELLEKSRADADSVLKALGSQLGGLSEAEANSRLKQVGTNEIGREKHQSAVMRLLSNLANPLVLLLMALGVISYLTGDMRATVVIFVMVVQAVQQHGNRSGALDRPTRPALRLLKAEVLFAVVEGHLHAPTH
ncbi:MAG: cation-transporting P-type ATPase, partial [Thermoguttaceae bacterium]